MGTPQPPVVFDLDIFHPADFAAPDAQGNVSFWKNPLNYALSRMIQPDDVMQQSLSQPQCLAPGDVFGDTRPAPSLVNALIALLTAYWYRFSQDANARRRLLGLSDDAISAGAQNVFQVSAALKQAAAAALGLAPDTDVNINAIALTLVKHALLRWADNDWLLRLPTSFPPPA